MLNTKPPAMLANDQNDRGDDSGLWAEPAGGNGTVALGGMQSIFLYVDDIVNQVHCARQHTKDDKGQRSQTEEAIHLRRERLPVLIKCEGEGKKTSPFFVHCLGRMASSTYRSTTRPPARS